MDKPEYVYVASSWRNPMQPTLCRTLDAAGISNYDFKDSNGFHWTEAGMPRPCTFGEYMAHINHPRAVQGYQRDMSALDKADCCVLVMPCGRSAHLELGYAIGQGKRTAILYEPGTFEPDLMHKAVDYMTDNLMDLLGWLGVAD